MGPWDPEYSIVFGFVNVNCIPHVEVPTDVPAPHPTFDDCALQFYQAWVRGVTSSFAALSDRRLASAMTPEHMSIVEYSDSSDPARRRVTFISWRSCMHFHWSTNSP